MSRAPVQARSVESMQRMLDAGEELFAQGGSAALKLELILERSGASTGSFYARFGGMSGYLQAMHERAHERLSAATARACQDAAAADTLEAALTAFCSVMAATIRQESETFRFFAAEQAYESAYRDVGTRAQLEARRALIKIMSPYLSAPKSAAAKRRMDMVFRLILAMLFQQFMFNPEEVSPLELSDKALVREWVAVLVTGLESVGVRGS